MAAVNPLLNKELADVLAIKGEYGALLVTTRPGRNKPAVLAFNEQVVRLANRLSFSAGPYTMTWQTVSRLLPQAYYYLDDQPVSRQEARRIKKVKTLVLLRGPAAADYAHDPAAATGAWCN